MRAFTRVAAVIAAMSLGLVGGVAAAAPAGALDGTSCAAIDYRLPVGTVVTFTFDGDTCTFDAYEIASGPDSVIDDTTEGVGTVTFVITNTSDWYLLYATGDVPELEQWITGCDVPDAYAEGYYPDVVDLCASVSVDQTPPPVGQGVGMPASGSCVDVSADAVTFAQDVIGGWSKSWEPWANAGAPEGERWGWACIRTLEYAGSGWRVQAS